MSDLQSVNLQRRKLLKASTLAVSSAVFPQLIQANISQSKRRLEFVNLHTNETSACCYWANDEYLSEGLASINYILRDHRAEEIYPIDPALLDILHTLHERTGSTSPFHLISGYRSPNTNARLRKNSNGVAKRSLHMQGKAIDVRLPDVSLTTLQQAALSLNAGGVGFYAKSNFLHLDTGRPRSW